MFSHSRTGILVTAAAASLLLLGGCSPGDVQLEGKIFEYMGVSGQPQRARDPKLADRAPLVLPPSLERLPEPGSQAREQGDDLAVLADPDRSKVTNKAVLERQQAEFCEKHFEQAKARGDLDAEDAKGPLGPCRGSILTALPKWLKGEQDGQQDQ